MIQKMRMTEAPQIRLKGEVALDLISAVGQWVRGNSSIIERLNAASAAELLDPSGDFWNVLHPVFEELISGEPHCAWCTAGVRVDSARLLPPLELNRQKGFIFHPKGRSDVVWNKGDQGLGSRTAWKLASLVSKVSGQCRTPPFETLLTSDLCINVLSDNRRLFILDDPEQAEELTEHDGWVVIVKDLSDILKEGHRDFESILGAVAEAAGNEKNLTECFSELDARLREILLSLRRSAFDLRFGKNFCGDKYGALVHELNRGGIPSLALAKYLVLMTVIWPQWHRIAMLPHLGPCSSHAQPSGIVICEDEPAGERLSIEELELVGLLTSVAMWPWAAFGSEHSRDFFARGGSNGIHILTPKTRLERVVNDYSEHSALLGLEPIELVDTLDEQKLATMDRDSAESYLRRKDQRIQNFLEGHSEIKGVSIVIPVHGGKRRLAECLRSIGRQSLLLVRPASIEITIVQDGKTNNPQDDPTLEEVTRLVGELPEPVNVRFVQLKNQHGRAKARNVGLVMSTREIALFVDASMVLDREFLTEKMIRHDRLDNAALLGFKENIEPIEFEHGIGAITEGSRRPDFRKDWKCSHSLGEGTEDFTFKGRGYRAGEPIDYMSVSDWLNRLHAFDTIGRRSLATFFQTNIVSVARDAVLRVGGFHSNFRKVWGFEDSFLGALLLARGVRLVPCPSARAFKIEHTENATKRVDENTNRSLYQEALEKNALSHFCVESLTKSVERLRSSGEIEHVWERGTR